MSKDGWDIAKSMEESRAAEDRDREAFNAEWGLLDYTGDACEKCDRVRVCRCPNGKLRCEKCSWSPQEGRYVQYG